MIPENRRYSNFRKEARLKKWITIFGFAIVVFSWAGAAKSDSPLTVVDVVDLNRYLGMWYEIASYPSWFQKGCTGSTAEYSLLSDGKIQVINRCHKDSLEGPLKVSKGKAEVVDTTTNAKLKVWFFWPFKGNYWIIDLSPDYQWARGGGTLKEISVDSQPYAHHGRGGLSGNFRAFAAKRLRSCQASQNGSNW